MQIQHSPSVFNTHEAFKAFQAVNFTADQAEVLISLLNEQTVAQSLLLNRTDFNQAIEKKADKDDIKLLIEQMNNRFEVVDKRFEAVQQQMDMRFEAVQQQMDARFEAMQQQMNLRFGQLTKRIDRFMVWSFSTTVTVGGLVVTILKWT